MAIKNVNKPIFTQSGKGDLLSCPNCKKEVQMNLFENINGPIDVLLLGKKEPNYFAVCPSCAAVFSVNPNYMYERNNGTTVLMTESDLIKTEKSDKNA